MKANTHPSFASTAKDLGVQLCLSAVAMTVILRLWSFHWLTPFNYRGDAIYQLSLAKSIAQGGWIWFIDRLSAPDTLAIGAFPQNLTISSAMMRVIAVFTNEPGLILNLFWLTAILLTSVSCFIALRSLGIAKNTNWVMSTLYALLPYALIRNTTHICLTFIFVPIISAYAVQVLAKAASSAQSRDDLINHNLSKTMVLIALIGVGFDFIYNAFFSCFFLFVAGLMAWLQTRNTLAPKKMAWAIGCILFCVLLNLLPSLWIWHDLGRPPSYKSIGDAEVYGLKIRHMLSSPVINALFPPKAPINFPLENENTSAVLGLVGAIGLVSSIIFGLLGNTKQKRFLWAAGTLSIWGILFGTIGGLGAIFNQFISPDIRAYNRISVFIAFFAFFTFAALVDYVQNWINTRLTPLGKPILIKVIQTTLLGIILIFALIDQGRVIRPYLALQSYDFQASIEERDIVQKIEALQPPIHQIYQLPETPFPLDSGQEKMGPYDQGRPYLWSNRVRWSWPSYSNQHQEWVKKVGGPFDSQFLSNIVSSGFDGLWIDRFGYSSSDLNKVDSKLRNTLGPPTLESTSGRYQFYKLRSPGSH
jgi:phosphoglycerol transferase